MAGYIGAAPRSGSLGFFEELGSFFSDYGGDLLDLGMAGYEGYLEYEAIKQKEEEAAQKKRELEAQMERARLEAQAREAQAKAAAALAAQQAASMGYQPPASTGPRPDPGVASNGYGFQVPSGNTLLLLGLIGVGGILALKK